MSLTHASEGAQAISVDTDFPAVITTAEEANAAHRQILKAVGRFYDLGKYLKDIKASLRHGEWIPHVEANYDFDVRTAQRYIAKYDSVSHLDRAEAVKLLEDRRKANKPSEEKPKHVEPKPVREAEIVSLVSEPVKEEAEEPLPAIDFTTPETTLIADVVRKHDKNSILVIKQERFEDLVRGILRPLIQKLCQQDGYKHAPTMRCALLNVLGELIREVQPEAA
jgi:Protein of unknown function (DUF3102)